MKWNLVSAAHTMHNNTVSNDDGDEVWRANQAITSRVLIWCRRIVVMPGLEKRIVDMLPR